MIPTYETVLIQETLIYLEPEVDVLYPFVKFGALGVHEIF